MGLPENVEEVRETLRKIQKNLECPICLELLSDPYTTQCSHPFCRTCIYTVISSTREAKCPLCKMPISRRSMNENARLAEIVEAVKELEQAITKDSGVPSTPPRPLPPHSHEATGTPGVIVHSLLHPTPQKPPGTHREVAMTGRDSGNSDSGCKMRPAVASTDTTSNRHCSCSSGESGLKVKHRKRVRFASAKPTKRRKIPRLESSNQAALLQALEEVDFADPDVSSNSFVHTKSDELRLQNVLAIPQLEVAGEERKGAGVATAAMDREAGLNSPERKKPRMEHSWIPNNDFENISKVLETPGVEPLVHTRNAIVTESKTDSITSHFSQDEEAVEGVSTSQPQRIAHSPWPVQGGNPSNCTTKELVKHTPLGAHSAEMTSETAWIEIVQETPNVHCDSQHQRTQDKYRSAVTPNPESHPELPPYKQENLGSDTMVLAEETQFTETSTIMQTDTEGSAVPCVVEETQITSSHSQTVTQGISLQNVTPPRGDTDKHGPPQVCCTDENQPECQTHEVSLGGVPTNYCESAAEGSTSNSPSTGGGDSTVSLSLPKFIVKSSPTSLTGSQSSLDHNSKSNHSMEHLDSTNSTTPDLHPESLQNGLQTSPIVSSTQANAPTCSSPKSAEVPILPPLFTSPPLTKTTSQWHSSSHFDNHVLSFPPYLDHSISPSIPLQNVYSNAAAPRSSATQEKTVIPDTYCTVKSGVSKVSETQLESVPSSQLSPVARAVHTPPLPGLYRTVGGCLLGSIQEHNVTTPTSSPLSHGNKRSPTNGKSDATLPNQLSQSSASPPATTVLQLTSSQVTPSGGGCPPPSLPDSLTVIPDSLLPPTKHQPSPSHDSTAQLSPHETVNAASELSMSTGSSSTALQRSSGGILSPGRDTCTQWDVKSSTFSQDLTSQELEALRQQMEEKEQEILELEALLLQRKKHPSAEAQPETNNSTSKIPDSVDISLAPEGTCCSHCQPENSPATRDEKCRSPNPPIQTSSTAAHQSPEITVIGETIPDSFPTITLSGVSQGARNSLLLPDSEKRQCFSEHEPSSNDSNVEYDCGEHHQGRMVSTSNAIMSKTDSQPTTQDPSTASSYSSTRTKALVQKADVLLKSLQQPLPLKETFCTRHSTKAVDLEVPKPLPPSVVKTASKGHGTPLTSQKEKEKNQTHTPGKIAPSNPPVSNWPKKPSPKTSSNVVLETATKLIKALRSPPKVVLESQTTLDVDAGFFDVSPLAGGNAAAKHVQPKAQGSTKQQINGKSCSPVPAAARQKAKLSSRPKRKKRPLVVLDSQDLESSSPPPHCVPLPPNHPFLSISTSPYHHTSSKQSGCYPGIGEAVTTVGNVLGTHTGPCEENCSLDKHHKSISDSTTSKDQAFPHEQQSLLTMERKTKYITSAVGTPCIQLSGSVCSAECPRSRTTGGGVRSAKSPPSRTTGGGVRSAESPPSRTTGGGVCPAESPPLCTTSGGVCPTESPPSRTTGGGVCPAKSPPSRTTGGGVCPVESPPSRTTGGGVCPVESPPSRTTGRGHYTKPPSFIASGLTKAQLYQAQILAKNHGGRIASRFNGSTTHIIVQTDENGCCPRTVKYLQGLAAGKWIVGYNWVKDSLEAGMLLPEAGYEVRGDSVCGGNAPHKAHKLRSAGEPGLFHHCNFYLAGQFSGISQDHLAQLIQLADGTLTQTIPEAMVHELVFSPLPPRAVAVHSHLQLCWWLGDSRTIVICDNRLSEAPAWLHCDGLAVLPSSWVLDSLNAFCYQLRSISTDQ